jgi:hypothetical protein
MYTTLLREEKGSRGVDIPPGIPATQGILYEVDDSLTISTQPSRSTQESHDIIDS